MRRALTALFLAALLAFVATGCGGDSDEPEGTGGSGGAAQTTTAGEDENGSGSGDQSGSSDQGSEQADGGSDEDSEDPSDPVPEAPPGGDNSIQTFGSEAADEEEEEIAGAMLDFFDALAAADGDRVCEGITDTAREQIEKFLAKNAKSCGRALASMLAAQKAEARRAAEGTVAAVRVDGDRAIVLFRPPGEDIEYFAMVREGDRWRALSLATGTALELTTSAE